MLISFSEIPISMKNLFLILVLAISSHAVAQPAVKALEDKSLDLKERYATMKTGSQTFQDYKVIKEYVLDGVWKIVVDSINHQHRLLNDARTRIATLENEVKQVNQAIETQKASIEGITYDSTHISVIGIPFTKGVFLLLSAAVVAGLVLFVTILLGRLRITRTSTKEKTLLFDSLSQEFEEYKKKALEKQTKLSRELQNERNKLQEMRGYKA